MIMEYIAGRKYLIKEECQEEYGKWVVAKENRKNSKWLPCYEYPDEDKFFFVKTECIERESKKEDEPELFVYKIEPVNG